MDPRKSPLSEDQFIHEGYKENPYPFWFWLFLLAVMMCLTWGAQSWYQSYLQTQIKQNPFLQVKNRDLSLFLWQNPEFMRVNASKKSGYLPGFQFLEKVTLEPAFADVYATAPPELLFLYHTWNRQIRHEFPRRKIDPQEFMEFLHYAEEWQPSLWPDAPQEYAALVVSLPNSTLSDLQTLPETVLPEPVRMAFQGWKNFFKEGEAINKSDPTYGQMEAFLALYPHYARNYWRNISSLHYLKTLSMGAFEKEERIPFEELSPFLRVAFFNYQKGKEGL